MPVKVGARSAARDRNQRNRRAGDMQRLVAMIGRTLRRDRQRWLRGAFVVGVVLIALIAHWGLGAIVLLGLLAASGAGFIDSRVSVVLGLLCLACCPLVIVAQQGAWLAQSVLVGYYAASVGLYTLSGAPNTLTLWAFSLIGIGLAGQVIRYVARQKVRHGV